MRAGPQPQMNANTSKMIAFIWKSSRDNLSEAGRKKKKEAGDCMEWKPALRTQPFNFMNPNCVFNILNEHKSNIMLSL